MPSPTEGDSSNMTASASPQFSQLQRHSRRPKRNKISSPRTEQSPPLSPRFVAGSDASSCATSAAAACATGAAAPTSSMSPPGKTKAEELLGDPCWFAPARAGGARRFESLLAQLQEAHEEEVARLELDIRRLQCCARAGRPLLPMEDVDEGEALGPPPHDNEEPPVRSAAVKASVRATVSTAAVPRPQLQFVQPVGHAASTPPLAESAPLPERSPRNPEEPPREAYRRAQLHGEKEEDEEEEEGFERQPRQQANERDAEGERPPADRDISPVNKKAVFRAATSLGDRSSSEFIRKLKGSNHRLRTFAESTMFDVVFCMLILLSAVFFAVELELMGAEQGALLSVYKVSVISRDYSQFFNVVQWSFSVIFTVELLLKLGSIRLKFFFNMWNCLDAIIVATMLLSVILEDKYVPFDLKPLRVARLVRLLRLMNLFQSFQAFDSLYLMVTAMKQCIHILAWTCALGLLLQLMLSLLITEFLYGFYFCQDIAPEGGSGAVCRDLPASEIARQKEVYLYYGTCVRSLFTMFELTLANWPPAARVLSENVHWSFMVVAVMHKLVIGFAGVAVVTGVITKETFKVAELDDQIMVIQTERQLEAHVSKMKALFAGADTSDDGKITLAEFRNIMENDEVRLWLASMGMHTADVDQVFTLIDINRNGEITTEELAKGVSRLKGAARSLELALLMDEHSRMHQRITEHFDSLTERKVATIEGDEVEARRGSKWANAVVTQARNQMVCLKWASDGVEDQVSVADVRVKDGPVADQRARSRPCAVSRHCPHTVNKDPALHGR